MVNVKVIHTSKDIGSFVNKLTKLARKRVLVGVPAERSTRPEVGEKINNAELLYILSHGVRKKSMRDEMQKNIDSGMKYSAAHSLYIQSHGSPLWQIPPRPVLEPAIEESKTPIAKQLKLSMKSAIDGNTQETDNRLHMAGMVAENAVKAWFENPANKWPPNSPKTIAKKGSDSPMIDTGEMRKAITHIIREE